MSRNNKRLIAVIGTGMMATGIAALATGHGFKVGVFARSPERAAAITQDARGSLEQMKEHGVMSAEQIDICMSYMFTVLDYKGLSDAEVVFECVVENPDVKGSVYRLIGENCLKVKAICSVSSSIVPDKLAELAGKYKDRIMITHPFNPPHLVPFFELCAASCTTPETVEYVTGFLRELDRKPVLLKKATPGFIGNRLQFALWREALALVEEGVCEPKDIDTCLNYSFCPRYTSIGIFDHFDNGGLELNATVCKTIWPVLSKAEDIPEFMQTLMEEGKTGARSEAGQGFYDWRDVDMKAYGEKVSEPYWKFCKWNFPKEKKKEF